MKAMHRLTLIILIIGGINWGLFGAFQFDLVAALFGGQESWLSRIVYVIVGLCALWQIGPLTRAFQEKPVFYSEKVRT